MSNSDDDFTSDYDPLYQKYGKQYGIDPLLLKAQGIQESGLNPDAVGPDTKYGNAVGIAQMIPDTAKRLKIDPTIPEQAIEGQARLMAENIKRYGDTNGGLSAYHGGTNTDNWGPKTKDYVQKINQRYAALKGTGNTTTVAETEPAVYTTTAQQADPNPPQIDEKNLPSGVNTPPNTDSGAPQNSQSQSRELDMIAKSIAKDQAATNPQSSSTPPPQSRELDMIAKSIAKDQTQSKQAAINNTPPTEPAPWYAKPALQAITAEKGFAQGLHSVGSGVQNLLGGKTTLGGVLSTPEEYAAQKAEYEKTWGNPALQQAGIHGAPVGEVAGQIVGTAPALAAGGEVAGAASGAMRAVPYLGKAANFLTGGLESNAEVNAAGQTVKAASLGNKTARLASTVPVGAAGGATANALVGQDPVQGAEIGATLGPPAHLLGSVLESLVNKGSSLIGNGSSKLAPYMTKLKQGIIRDGFVTPSGAPDIAAVENKLTKLGPNATLADIGPNTRDLAGAVAQAPGEGKEIIANALEERQAGQSDRLKQTVLSGLGLAPEETYESAVPKLIEQRKNTAAPIYKDAFTANKSIMTPEISNILKTPAGTAAMKKAVTAMQNGRELVGISDPDLVEQAALAGTEPTGDGIAGGLKLKTLDKIKQSLWDLGERAKDQFGKDTMESNNIHDLRSDLINELDNADATAIRDKNGNITAPGKYSQARKAYSEPSQSLDALDSGKQFIKNGGAENSNQLATMSEEDKRFFRIGASKQIHDTIHATPDGADAVKRIFNTPAKREALKSVFPSEEAFNDFSTAAQNESTFYKTKGAIGGNSLTNQRRLASDDAATPLQKTVGAAAQGAYHLGELAQRNLIGKGVYLGKLGLNRLMQPGVLSQQDAEALAHALITPEGRKAVIKSLTPSKNAGSNRLNDYISALHNSAMGSLGDNKLNANP